MGNLANFYQRKPRGSNCNFIKEAKNGFITSYDPGSGYWKDFQFYMATTSTTKTKGTSYNSFTSFNGTRNFCNLIIRTLYYGGVIIHPPSSSWWAGGGAGYGCNTNTSRYLDYMFTSGPNAYIIPIIDIWAALEDGLWSSSVAFTVRTDLIAGFGPQYNLIVGNAEYPPGYYLGFADTLISGTVDNRVSGCTGGVIKTMTVYSDGRITLT